jgi:uncharacterized protein YjbI with pentapeptide repeats
MANEDHVALLERDVEAWNEWRKENLDVVMPDLRRADLPCADLQGVDLQSADLQDAQLPGANLAGANLWNAQLKNADLSVTNLASADLRGANLWNADLTGADLQGADLRGANLGIADLGGADLTDANLADAVLPGAQLTCANLSGANLAGAKLNSTNLDGANLIGADLHEAILFGAGLIDSCLDGANLNGVKLWETQRSGWSIKGITCQRAFWDRNGKEPIEYEDGAFERAFTEKPRIILRYAGGISPVDLAMLPLIIERLQADHPKSSLHIRSVQDDGGAAAVTITVEDLAGRSSEVFAKDVEALRGDLVMVQQRLQQEERLRLAFEAKYSAVVRDILPMMMERALPRTEVNIGQLTAPMTIEGTTMSKKTYNVHGQAGAVGDNAHAHDMTFQQVQNQSSLDLPRLAEELGRLRTAMKEAEGKDDQDEAIGAVAAAEKAAIKGDAPTALRYLKAAGKWTLGIAERIGVAVATEAIKRAM